MSTPMVIGVDPGARDTGLCVIAGRDVVTHDTVNNPHDLFPAHENYLHHVVLRLNELVLEHDCRLIAVESIRRPNWHMKGRAAADPSALLATAEVLGAVLSHRWLRSPIVQVPPGRNGSNVLGAYPTELVSASERRAAGWQLKVGGGKLRHARSAYDVAVSGAHLHLNGAIA
ncbi:crossover junction endodeoxyribonuclease RuvC [Rhodococcus daqingensis]|uniref:Crossover junction endodeoxyribonuclease RuvC n=1 Tax=Rhodococcus daqingensis TaxID=2479363 RepID=A0ABW2S2Z1_9NOCA